MSLENPFPQIPKFEGMRASLSSIKPSKGDTDTESDVKVKRTVFKDYKESAKLPSNPQKQKRENMKRGSRYTNNIDSKIYDNAVIQKEKEKPKPAPNRIIKKIAESLDAWQTNKKMNKGRNQGIGNFLFY